VEKSQHRLRITTHWDGVVSLKRCLLGMEVVRTEFPSVGSWQTSVVSCSILSQRLMISLIRSGCRKKHSLVRHPFNLPALMTDRLSQLFSSSVIQDIDSMRKFGLASLAFFYCDFREEQKKDFRGLLSSLLVQLCHQSDSYCDILSYFIWTMPRARGILAMTHPSNV